MKTKARNGKIDFYKFIFSIIIVIHHSRNLVGDDISKFLGGSFAVEFFFLVSGYLMMKSIKKLPDSYNNLGIETRDFIIKKYKSVCPEIIIAYIIALIFVSYAKKTSIFDLFVKTFFEGFLIRMTGIHIGSINAAVWYISSMILCMVILYPLLRRFPDMSINVVIPLCSLLILGYFCGNETSPRNPTLWIGLTYKGNLRSFAELGIGICLFNIVEKIKNSNYSKFGKITITVLEHTLYLIVIAYMYFETASRRDYFYLILLSVAIALSFSQKGIDATIFNNKLFYFWGKYSLSLFLSHAFYAGNLNYILPETISDNYKMIIYFLCSFITAFVVMFISDMIRKNMYKIKKIFNVLFFK